MNPASIKHPHAPSSEPTEPGAEPAPAGAAGAPALLPELLQMALDLKGRDQAYAMVTVVRAVAPTSAYAGAQAIVCADGSVHGWIGGGCSQRVVVDAARKAMDEGVPRLVRIANDGGEAVAEVEQHRMPCASNGEIELFIHPHAAPRLLILGTTPVAAATRRFAQEVGFGVADTADAGAPMLAIVATQGQGDEAALESALGSSAPRVLFVASTRKADKLREALRVRGLDAERLARLEAPAGLDIGARTPTEIALSLVAAAVAWRRTGRTDAPVLPAAVGRQAPAAARVSDQAAGDTQPRKPYVNPVCGMIVDPAQARHTVHYQGMAVYFCCDGCKDEFARSPAKYAALQAAARATLPAGGRS